MAAGLLLAQASASREKVEASWQVTLPTDSKGYSVVVAPESSVGLTDITEPNYPGVLSIGFNTSSPKTTDAFNANGNIYGRPEREVCLHFDGVEIANRLSPVDMKTGRPVSYRVRLDSVVGGSDVSVWVGDKPVYDHYFVPRYKPLDGRWSYAMEPGIQAVRFRRSASGKVVAAETPTHVSVFDRETNNAGRHRFESVAHLPAQTDEFGRVVGTLVLAPTPQGLDPWDRIAQIWLVDEKGERFEILRYITPYNKAWTWRVDLTRFLPLLKGDKTFKLECETYGAGWLVSFDLDFYRGSLRPRPVQVLNVWNGTATLGQPEKFPLTDLLKAKSLDLGSYTKAEFWATVTGHGMSPNSDNAAEFLPLWRKLYVGSAMFQNTLWKEDVYLNPCRPQGGTWKYDRAGWAPGDVVTPWVVDITRVAKQRGATEFKYEIQPYTNKTPADGNPARHIIESTVVIYR